MRKRRTRQHQIEDLSYNFVEAQVLDAFCVMRRYTERDYSYDASVRTFVENGEIENGEFYIQVKATDNLRYSRRNKGYELTLERRDLELWLNQRYPVLVVLYDAKRKRGFYIDLHKYFRENRLLLRKINKNKQVFLSPKNEFSPQVVKYYRTIKNEINETFASL